MAVGLPVVAYNYVASPTEMMEVLENRYLIRVFDDASFQFKLENLIKNERLRQKMCLNAKRDIRRFNSDLIAEKNLKFILSNN